MKLRDFVPPVVAATFNRFIQAKAFTALATAFLHGDELHEGQANHLIWPYKQSAWVHAAINHIAGELASRELCFYQGDEPFTDPKLAAWWEAPAMGPATSGIQTRLNRADVIRDLASWAKLEGEFFICFDDSWAVAGLIRNPATLTPFLIARPDRMRLIVRGGQLEGYEYSTQDGKRMVFLPEQVKHWKAFNPYDDWRGLGDYKAASVATEGAFLTGVYIRDLMRNNGDQGMIVIGKNGVADDAQREQIVANLRAKRHALRMGIAKDLFLTGDISVERPKEEAAGADVMAGKSLSHQEIFIAFGVPPSMAEVKASYSIGKDSDYYQLIIRTCMPLGKQIAGVFAAIASRMSGRALSAELEWDDHPVMVEVRNGRLESALKLWGAGMAWKDINSYLDLGMQPFTGWEIPYLPFSVTPVGAGNSPVADPALAETPAAEADGKGRELPEITALKLLVATRARSAQAVVPAALEHDEFRFFSCCHDEVDGPIKCFRSESKARDPKRIARWKDHMAKRRTTMKQYESRINRELMTARVETLKKIAAHATAIDFAAKHLPGEIKAVAADLVFNKQSFGERFFAAMRKQGSMALDTAGQQLLEEIDRKDDVFKYPSAAAKEFLSKRENRLGNVPDEIFEKIKRTLGEGLDDGDTSEQLAARVKGAFNAISDGRARTIAATETSAAYGAGRDQAMTDAGVQWKEWLTSGNSNVRPAHLEAEGQTVSVDEDFSVDGEDLSYPGDSDGSPGNVINCHCVSIAVAKPADS